MPAAVKAEHPDARYFREIVEAIGKIADEVALQFQPEGLKVAALDPSSVALISVDLPREAFAEYSAERPVNVGVSVANLARLLKAAKKGDRLLFEADEESMALTLASAVRRVYRFRSLDIKPPEIPSASLEFSVEAQLIADALKTAIKDVEEVGEQVELEATQDALFVRAKGAGTVETKFASGSPSLISLTVKEPSKSKYLVSFISAMIGLARISEAVSLKFGNNSPLQLEFLLTAGKVSLLLAPSLA